MTTVVPKESRADAGEPLGHRLSPATTLVVTVACTLAVVVLAEWGSRRLVADPPRDVADEIVRPDDVVIVLKDPALLPAPKDEPSLWMIGNSHTYALPGMNQGDALRTDAQGILIDEMASNLQQGVTDKHVHCYLLAYPNFLPFEMLTRVGHLLYGGHRPSVVFIGLTWRNIARDSQVRQQVYATYRDANFDDAFLAMLESAEVQASPDVLSEVRAQRVRVEHDQEIARLRSDSDRLDEMLTHWVGEHLTLMGKSSDLRATIFRGLTDRVQRLWDDRKTQKYTYDLIEHDYLFNVDCLRAMVRLLKRSGAQVYCYYAPERTDLPPLMDPARQTQFIEVFNKEAQELGITVLDARPLVPNEYWGWVGESPDRSHFTEPGHQRLAKFLFDEADQRSTWREIARP